MHALYALASLGTLTPETIVPRLADEHPRVREHALRLSESLADPQLKARNVLHRHEKIEGIEGPVTVPLAAFKFADGGPSIESPPPRLGQHTDEVLASLGYSKAEITKLREEGAI